MGMDVSSKGVTLWSPALQVGYLFYEQVKMLEKAVNAESGIDMRVSDLINVDAEQLDLFLQQASQWLVSSNNGPLHSLVAGCLQILIVLYFRASGAWPRLAEGLQPLVESAEAVMRPVSNVRIVIDWPSGCEE